MLFSKIQENGENLLDYESRCVLESRLKKLKNSRYPLNLTTYNMMIFSQLSDESILFENEN